MLALLSPSLSSSLLLSGSAPTSFSIPFYHAPTPPPPTVTPSSLPAAAGAGGGDTRKDRICYLKPLARQRDKNGSEPPRNAGAFGRSSLGSLTARLLLMEGRGGEVGGGNFILPEQRSAGAVSGSDVMKVFTTLCSKG